jgi:hypothetical protein
MLSEEDKELILNYGRLSYENGFRDGYSKGLITACFITIIGICTLKVIHK